MGLSLAIGPWSQLPDWELTGAKSRAITWRLGPGANSEASFDVDARHPDCARIFELVTDLWAYWDGTPIYRGRAGSDHRAWSGPAQTRSVSTADYRAVLARRELFDLNTRTWSAKDQALIVWQMIQQTQGNDGGDLGIVRGVGQTTGVTRDFDAEAGSYVAPDIDKLAQMDDGFDWDITPTTSTALHLDIWHPTRGTDRGMVLEHGSNAQAISRDVDPSQYGNAGRWTGGAPAGGSEPTPELREATDIATRSEGRWDVQDGDPDITGQSALSAYADGQFAQRQVVTPSWSVKLARKDGADMVAANVWEGPDQIWLGDPVLWVCRSGDLDVAETLRVAEVALTASDAGTIEVELTLGALPPSSRRRARRVDQRLTTLERR